MSSLLEPFWRHAVFGIHIIWDYGSGHSWGPSHPQYWPWVLQSCNSCFSTDICLVSKLLTGLQKINSYEAREKSIYWLWKVQSIGIYISVWLDTRIKKMFSLLGVSISSCVFAELCNQWSLEASLYILPTQPHQNPSVSLPRHPERVWLWCIRGPTYIAFPMPNKFLHWANVILYPLSTLTKPQCLWMPEQCPFLGTVVVLFSKEEHAGKLSTGNAMCLTFPFPSRRKNF